MSASFALAVTAAREAAAAQHYPQGALYVVATPIGNLADMGLRALHVLELADTLACEDTRHTQQMLRAFGIDKAPGALLALHQHNESSAAQTVLERLRAGQRVACVSDAGTPGISDPGARLAAAVTAHGLRCIPVPGASSVTALLCVAGLTADTGFLFQGFLPAKSAERAAALAALAHETRAVVVLEAPHRVAALARGLAALGTRRVTLGRELTKQFEEIATLEAAGLSDWLDAQEHRQRGEFVLVLHPAAATGPAATDTRVLELLLAELPLKTAVRLAAEITGQARNALYECALALRQH